VERTDWLEIRLVDLDDNIHKCSGSDDSKSHGASKIFEKRLEKG